MSTEQITSAAMKLTPKRKAQLAEQLLASLDIESQKKIDAAWSEEAEARIDAYDAGRTHAQPIQKVLRSLRRRVRS